MKKLLLVLLVAMVIFAPLAGRAQEAEPAAGSTAAAPAFAEADATAPAEAEGSTPAETGGSTPAAPGGPVIKVLTFNTWCIVSAKVRDERAEAIGRRIAELNPDIVSIQEMFEERHRKILMKALAEAGWKPQSSLYFNRLYGSGILFLSKYPVLSVNFEPYRVNSPWYDIERIGGKGIAHLLLDTPHGRLDFFVTHALSRTPALYDAEGNFIPGDPKQVDRLLQMFQIDRFVRSQRSPWGRSMIATGDFNVSPEMLEFQMLVRLTGFESSFDLLNPGQNPSTFCAKTNMWVKDDFSRLDHIFFKNYAGNEGFWLKPITSRVEMEDRFNAADGRDYNYSDHFGIYSEFEVVTDPAAMTPSPEGIVRGQGACAGCAAAADAGNEISLSPENAGAWNDYALWVLGDAYNRKARTSALVIPMAEVLVAAPTPAATPAPAPAAGGTAAPAADATAEPPAAPAAAAPEAEAPAEPATAAGCTAATVADAGIGPTVKLNDQARAEMKKRGCPRGCGANGKVAGKPGDESLARKLQSFSPWRKN